MAQRSVIEEQPGIEVIEQVDPQARSALAHHEGFTTRPEPARARLRVLAATLAACARLDGDALAWEPEHFARSRQHFAEAPAHVGFGDFRRRGVFLHVQP
jgi:hypothetical protein